VTDGAVEFHLARKDVDLGFRMKHMINPLERGHFCFRTDDVDAATERARAAGAEVTVEPKDIAVFGEPKIPVRLAFFKGPDGEICELMQQDVL